MEPGDLGLRPGLSSHLCDSKVKSANPVSLTSLLCTRGLCLPPGCRWGEGAKADNQGP